MLIHVGLFVVIYFPLQYGNGSGILVVAAAEHRHFQSVREDVVGGNLPIHRAVPAEVGSVE